jgi:hypothetical protein
METRSRIGKMCVCAVVLLAMVGMMLPHVIGERGKASPAVAELNPSSAPESVDDYAQMAITGDIPPIEERMKTQNAKGGGKDKANYRDTDGDGLTDLEENKGTFGYKTDRKNPDTDGDGLNDLHEYLWLCDPTDPDTNADWISDGDSVYRRETYPYTSDSLTIYNDPDGDGLPTGAERYDTGTDYAIFSTDGDPYGDGREYFGINMPSISPADHPLVAAYPDLSVQLVEITVTPKATITFTTGGATQEEWSITTETSDSETYEWGLEESIATEAGLPPKVTVTITSHETWANTHTTTNSETNSGWTEKDWSTAITNDTVDAAYLTFTMNVMNSGTAPAEEIRPDVNILLGGKQIATITSPTTINSLGMGEPSGNFVVDSGLVGGTWADITVTLDQLRAIDSGAPLDIETFQVSAKMKIWDKDATPPQWEVTDTDYSSYMWEIDNRGIVTLMFVLSDGTCKEYKVFVAASDNYNPDVTLGDAFTWTIDRDPSVPTQEEWLYYGFSADAFGEVREWIEDDNSLQDLILKPNWEVVVRAQNTEPEPQIGWAFYSADMKEVRALVTDDMGIEGVIAHVMMNISGEYTYTDLEMTDDNGDAIYVATTPEEMVEDEDAYVLATDIEELTAKHGII